MSQVVNKYKIYCNTEAIYTTGWSTSAPTTCYNNTAHSVNTNSIQIIDTIQSNQVVINQNNTALSSRFHIECISINNVLGGTTGTVLYTFDVATSLHSFNFAPTAADAGDTLSISINPDMAMGLITQNATSGDTILNMPASIMQYMSPGFFLTLTDGTNTNLNLKILSRNLVTNMVTVKGGVTHNYLATNTQVLLNFFTIKDMPVMLGTVYSFGGEVLAASNVPAGTVAKFSFVNNGTITKSIGIYLSGLI